MTQLDKPLSRTDLNKRVETFSMEKPSLKIKSKLGSDCSISWYYFDIILINYNKL